MEDIKSNWNKNRVNLKFETCEISKIDTLKHWFCWMLDGFAYCLQFAKFVELYETCKPIISPTKNENFPLGLWSLSPLSINMSW